MLLEKIFDRKIKQEARKVYEARNELWNKLYCASRGALPQEARSSNEAIRAKRDNECIAMFGAPFEELTSWQLGKVIDKLNQESGFVRANEALITDKQLKVLRYFVLAVGLQECKADEGFMDIKKYIEFRGTELEEFFLNKEKYIRKFRSKEELPGEVIKYIYNNWAHRYLIQILQEGYFVKRNRIKTPFIDFEKLTAREAQYLINRLSLVLRRGELC